VVKLSIVLLCALVLCLSAAAPAGDALVFSFFRNNGEDGLYLAASEDGLAWTVLNGDKPLLWPTVGESKLMRDPSIARGPDGRFHMVWTTSWKGRTIGYASSKDLVHWSEQRALEVMGHEPQVVNCWAPEIFYDAGSREYLVVWASTVTGKFAGTAPGGERGYNHRLYAFRTRDFKTIGATKLFYDPGFSVIDAAIVRAGDRYVMVAKNETANPPAKYLFTTSAASLDGPWSPPSPRISPQEWSEGPAPVRVGDAWMVYFDLYRQHRYGALRSVDLSRWEDVSARLQFPAGARHGSAFHAPRGVVDKLR
jgi:hypothetical protein